MENISKKRGRPKRFDDNTEAVLEATGLFTEITSERARTNIMYRQLALSVLMGANTNNKYGWLFDFECLSSQKSGARPKFTLLSELGRIADPAGICDMAAWLCEHKPSTREGILIIRRYRGVKADGPTKKTLSDELIDTINGYLRRYPDTEWQSVLEALNVTRTCVELSSEP